MATSQWPDGGFHTSAFLANMTLHPLEVRLFRARGPLDCAAIASDPMHALSSAFDAELCTPLEIGGILPLDRNWSSRAPRRNDSGAPAGGTPGADPPCDAVIIRVTDLPDTLLTWQQPGQVDVINDGDNLLADRTRDGWTHTGSTWSAPAIASSPPRRR